MTKTRLDSGSGAGMTRSTWWRTVRRAATSSALLALALVFTVQATVLAYTPQERRDMLERGISFVDEECTLTIPGSGEAPDVPGSADRNAIAQTIIGIAKTLNLGERGALIGIMTAITETGLKNYANDGSDGYQNTILGPYSTSLPHDAVGNDHDSVGIMQQRAVDGHWGPVDPKTNLSDNIKYLMTPSYAAEAFFAMPAGKKETKALVNVKGWQTMDPGAAAQAVQGSAFPDRYSKNQKAAQGYIDRLYDGTEPIPLLIALANGSVTGGGGATTGSSGNTCEKVTTAGGTQGILDYIKLYAWPTYCSASGRNRDGKDCGRDPLTAKVEYANAIKAAVARMDAGKGDYVGDPCGYNLGQEFDTKKYRVGVDCGGFVTRVMRDSGADPTYNNKYCNTSCQRDYLRNNSGAGKKYTRVTSQSGLKPGDIAVKDGHTFFYIGDALKDAGFDGNAASASQCQRAPESGGMDTFSDYEWYHLN
ncbi:MAG TPA: hypothetical protein VLE73_04985 [Candidatus Saccharimonadales bacterium]|nr:hypothetical protein [Candidatus Saccharimonadales bacterium]